MMTSDSPATGETPEGGANGHRCGFVALIGRANVGKSTLMNHLVGSKLSIVSTVPQTTRFPIRGILHRDSCQVVFIDTPGVHKPRYRLNEEMVRLTTRVLKEVDLVALLVDASDGFGPGDRYVFDLVRAAESRNFLILNKCDLIAKDRLLPMIDEGAQTGLFEEIVPLSAKTGDNCERLEEILLKRMPAGPPHFPVDTITDLPQRLLIAELIREQVLENTRQEVPHATAVVVDTIRDQDGLMHIDATIFVERRSQKGILIGERGRMMKEIGSLARRNIERHVGHRVHLSLWVKVREGWRDDTSLLRQIGLPLP